MTPMALLDMVTAELLLFAGVGLLIGGLDDLLVDLLYLVLRPWHRRAAPLPSTPLPCRFAIFVPAWKEERVIGPMLRALLARLEGDYRVYVGVYPNDMETLAIACGVAEGDPRVRVVVNPKAGPTTKADNLNAMWVALAADRRGGWQADALVLHDAEDLVHPRELQAFTIGFAQSPVVQLPVMPLVKRDHWWPALVSGHYVDEFAEADGKALVVRQWLRAGLPLAGTGCAMALPLLDMVADARGGVPFDASSLTEDYELGLALADLGASAVLARVPEAPGGLPVAVRAYFPGSIDAAVRQKARWMVGIALQGWDRTGWARSWNPLDHWMRLRDRRAPLAMLVLAAAYLGLIGWGVSLVAHRWAGTSPPSLTGIERVLLGVNGVLMGWRLVVRSMWTGSAYGWRQGLMASPRVVISNLVSLLAARRAMVRYLWSLAGGPTRWDKTQHDFPAAEASAGTA